MSRRPPPPADRIDQLGLDDVQQVDGADPQLAADATLDASDPVASEAPTSPDPQPVSGDADPPGASAADPEQSERSADAVLARIHLRGGLMALARAELEQMAGAGTLDTPALADLAETRWRSGDLAGAADAAQAHLDAGGEEPMAMLIVAEALDLEGHLIDARGLAARVLERVGGHVDRLFAGEARSSAWSTAGSIPTPLPRGTVAWGALAGGREVSQPELGGWMADVDTEAVLAVEAVELEGVGDEGAAEAAAMLPPAYPRGSISDLVDAGRAAGRELDAVETAIAEGRLTGVPERLGLLLRVDRALAPVILSHAEQALATTTHDDAIVAALHLVRGDAFRSLGHEAEANAAFQQSLRALAARATTEETT